MALGLLYSVNSNAQIDSLIVDSTLTDSIPSLTGIKIADGAIDSEIKYGSSEEKWIDNVNKMAYLYGDAYVEYQTLSLKADYIVIDLNTNIATASGVIDSAGTKIGLPEFKDGEETFTADSIRYNFNTRKGIVYQVSSHYDDIHILGSKTKFISGSSKVIDGDTIVTDDVLNTQGAFFTVCDRAIPHFGFRTAKAKIVPNKVAVFGPSHLEIMGIPTPIVLPFGMFPMSTSTQKAGLIIPKDYEFSRNWGYGIRDIGYFTPLGDNLTLSVLGDIYTRGSWALNVSSQYMKRYKFTGRVGLGYSSRVSEVVSNGEVFKTKQISYSINWSHSQAANAHPYQKFGGNINIQTNDYQSLNNNDAGSVLNNSLSSNLSYYRSFPGKPYTLSAAFNHSQNTRTNQVTVKFPSLDFKVKRLYPFKPKVRSGKAKWYQGLTFKYDASLQNQFTAADTTLFSRSTLSNARFGVKQKASSDISFKLFDFFNFSPRINYEEISYLKSIEKRFDDALTLVTDTLWNADSTDFTVVVDTTDFGNVFIDTLSGFTSYRTFNVGITMNTQLFGVKTFNKGWLRGIRHVIKPSISFVYSPDYQNPDLGYYKEVQTDIRPEFEDEVYSIYQGSVYGSPPRRGKQMAITYSINNIFEGKYFSKKDSSEKKFKLFDNIYIGGNYNFAADSLKWSQVSMRGTTRLFKGLTTISFTSTFDPYLENEFGRRLNVSVWDDRKKLIRFDNAQLRVNTNLSISKIKGLLSPKEESKKNEQKEKNSGQKSFTSMFDNFSIRHAFVLQRNSRYNASDTTIIRTNNIYMTGSISLTENWDIRVGSIGYDFSDKRLTYPDLGFTRKLHCWNMGLSWQPSRDTYSFYIRVIPGSMDFINIPSNKRNFDVFR